MEPNRGIRSIVLVMLPIPVCPCDPFSSVTFHVYDLPPMPFNKNRAQQVVVHTKPQTSSAQPLFFQISVVLVVATSDDICLACRRCFALVVCCSLQELL